MESERVVYCGIERCFFEVNIRNGIFQYVFSKRAVTTDSSRDGPPCPQHLASLMATSRSISTHRPAAERMPTLETTALPGPMRQPLERLSSVPKGLPGSTAGPHSLSTTFPSAQAGMATPCSSESIGAKASDVVLTAKLQATIAELGMPSMSLKDQTAVPSAQMARGQSCGFDNSRPVTGPSSIHGNPSLLTESLRQPCMADAPSSLNALPAQATPVNRNSLLHSRLHMSTSALLPCWQQRSHHCRRRSSGTNFGGSTLSDEGLDDEDQDSDDDVQSLGEDYVRRCQNVPLAARCSGAWRGEAGELNLRRLGVHSLPSGVL
jgi:hypothetical protein